MSKLQSCFKTIHNNNNFNNNNNNNNDNDNNKNLPNSLLQTLNLYFRKLSFLLLTKLLFRFFFALIIIAHKI